VLRSRRLPNRLSYCGECADAHLSFAKTAEYASNVATSANGLASAIIELAAEHVELIDWGIGSGAVARSLLERLAASRVPVRHFTGIDISRELLCYARSEVQKVIPLNCVSAWIEHDFEESSIREHFLRLPLPEGRRVSTVSLLLGNTLGNVESPVRTLRHVVESCPPRSIHYLGLSMLIDGRTGADYAKGYRNKEFADAAWCAPRRFGFTPENSSLKVDWSEPDGAVTAQLLVETAFAAVNLSGEISTSWVDAGQRFTVFVSRRFDRAQVNELLAAAGLRSTQLVDDSNGKLLIGAVRI
jgi:uncharacterized SAM-dependent methyltransferase